MEAERCMTWRVAVPTTSGGWRADKPIGLARSVRRWRDGIDPSGVDAAVGTAPDGVGGGVQHHSAPRAPRSLNHLAATSTTAAPPARPVAARPAPPERAGRPAGRGQPGRTCGKRSCCWVGGRRDPPGIVPRRGDRGAPGVLGQPLCVIAGVAGRWSRCSGHGQVRGANRGGCGRRGRSPRISS